VVAGQTKSLDFLDEQKSLKKNKPQAEVEPKQQFQYESFDAHFYSVQCIFLQFCYVNNEAVLIQVYAVCSISFGQCTHSVRQFDLDGQNASNFDCNSQQNSNRKDHFKTTDEKQYKTQRMFLRPCSLSLTFTLFASRCSTASSPSEM